MKNILLVDDDKIFNFLNQKILTNIGIADEIHTALNGQQAIQLINEYFQGSQSLPDYILLDLNMPIMDGFTFLEAFNKLNIPGKEKVTIIIITSSLDKRDIEKAKAYGINHYLTKPISEKDLRSVLTS